MKILEHHIYTKIIKSLNFPFNLFHYNYSDEIPLTVKLIYDQNEETELAPDLYVRARTLISTFSSIRNCSYFDYQILFFNFIDEILII